LLTRILSTTLITYFTIKFLEISEYSFWLIIMTFVGFVDVFDFGSASTLIRKFNYLLVGKRILPEEIYNNSINDAIDYHLLTDFKIKVNKYYRNLSLYFFLSLVLFGTFYLYSIKIRQIDYVMWAIFILVFIRSQ